MVVMIVADGDEPKQSDKNTRQLSQKAIFSHHCLLIVPGISKWKHQRYADRIDCCSACSTDLP